MCANGALAEGRAFGGGSKQGSAACPSLQAKCSGRHCSCSWLSKLCDQANKASVRRAVWRHSLSL